MSEPTIFELSKPDRIGVRLPKLDIPLQTSPIPPNYLRKSLPIPEIHELDVVRHYTRLSIMNHHVDKEMYPLGSCTMKYNPKINEELARLPGFCQLHPLSPANAMQGALQLMWELEEALKIVTGFSAVSLQPAAGAQGEFVGLLLMRAYHKSRGRSPKKIIIPDSAHGTNPASITLAGFEVLQLPSTHEGLVNVEELKKVVDENVAGLMITNPNTLGLFEKHIVEISSIIHSVDGLMYMDGANLNAIVGIVKPFDMGFDICHLNLHKTFSTPHGGGGPGSGPVCCRKDLEKFLPVPRIVHTNGKFDLNWHEKDSIGKVHTFFGNFGVFVRALCYIRMNGKEGLKKNSQMAVLNANYIRCKLQEYYDLPYPTKCMHEVVFSGDRQKKYGVRTLDIAKRLLDFGFHAPTVYFPLIVHEAIMIEPTETESLQTLDRFIEVMQIIAEEAQTNAELVVSAPTKTPVSRLNEALAAKLLDVSYPLE
ncbi:MAG: aminomethyl-transferring glycine dehydrogenase subunit GcvPB [bacterium]|nr:aminomethyl-transferring glycine dehydrogenase subunit GcvPB [bacterium]